MALSGQPQRFQQRRAEYAQTLRAKSNVRILLDPPRTQVSADDDPAQGPANAPVTIIEFSDFQCPFCSRVVPTVNRLHDRYGAEGLQVIAVSIDDAGAEEKIRAFRDEHRLDFLILHDATGQIQRDYQTTGVPETFVIGADGIIRKKVIGASDWSSEANRALIAQLLGVSAGSPADVPARTDVPVDSAGAVRR